MQDIDFWRLADDLTVVQAALLIAEVDPATMTNQVERLADDYRPPKYNAIKHAIVRSLLKGDIKGDPTPMMRYYDDSDDGEEIEGTIDIHRAVVEVESLREWLERRGFRSGFFFPAAAGQPDYLDASHGRYSPKLAAAVRAWLAIESIEDLKGRHPKQALLKWLRENAASYGLTDSEGKPMETSIDEIAKIANWQPQGGAPKTPVSTASVDIDEETTPDEDEPAIDF